MHYPQPLHRSWVATVAILTALVAGTWSSPSLAEEAEPTTVQPAALEAVQRMRDAYLGLNGLSATIRVDLPSGDKDGIVTEFTYQSPNRFFASRKASGREARAVSDGKTLWVTSSTVKERYLQTEAQPSRFGVSRQIIDYMKGAGFHTLVDLLNGDPLLPDGEGLRSLTLEESPPLNGVQTVNVRAVIRTFGTQKEVITLRIGKTDHLLREMTVGAVSVTEKVVETYTNLKPNPTPPSSLFTFTPPPGAQAVTPRLYHSRSLKRGEKPFPIQSTDLEGKPITLDQYKGKVALIYFWGTWCPACMAELPEIVSVYRKYKDKGFDVIGVPLEDAIHKIRVVSALKRRGLPWRQAFEGRRNGNSIAETYGVEVTPMSILIDRKGEIVAVGAYGEKELEAAVQIALKR